MTVVAIMAGLLPIMWSTGTGSEIMQRIAVPMIGGMISSTLLTLIVIPAIFGLVKERSIRAKAAALAMEDGGAGLGPAIPSRRLQPLMVDQGKAHATMEDDLPI
jgi:copper/silver efflux system protein